MIGKDIEFLKFNLFEGVPGIVHFITTREGGMNEGKFASLNLSLKVKDNPQHVLENRARLANFLGVSGDSMYYPDQCHTDHIKEIKKSDLPINLTETDGMVTRDKGLCLCILSADCVPVLLYDPVQYAIAALHAGWRGTSGRIICRAIERMVIAYASKPENILAVIGPAISQQYYEVGDEVTAHFRLLFSDHPEIIWRNPQTGKDHIDLKKANHLLLQRAGLRDEHIEISPICTYNTPGWFFSARSDGVECGRFATGIMLT